MDILIHEQGYILKDNIVIIQKISWIHMKCGIGESIPVFTLDYQLNKQNYEIVNTCIKEKMV